ncbi:hypothetical protein C1H46_028969 [Malus baccata]|uniref:ATP-dependent RNA helicase n=1 Tax=Malus baccata TaxID=106549 RepID=A0A540LGS5_MALBA|nr:hypothetical protein C1H46_028969 [Malus baccata]
MNCFTLRFQIKGSHFIVVTAAVAPEGSQFDARQYDAKMSTTGTGKTETFCSGILQQLDYGLLDCQALVLAPTRELAQQIEKVMRALGDYLGVKVHACVRGTSVREDQRILSSGVHVVVGTPGRVFDMLRRQSLRPDYIKMFVLDESDEKLSRGFKDQVLNFFFICILFLLCADTSCYKK